MKNMISAFVVVAAAGSALATPVFTPVGAPPGGEANLTTIFSGAGFGGHAAAQISSVTTSGNDFILNYVNGDRVRAIRIADSNTDGNSNLVLASSTIASSNDQIFEDGVVVSLAQARYAGFEQSFGYVPGASGGSFNSLFSVTGSGFAVTGSSNQTISNLFRFARRGTSGNPNGGDTWTSREADNNDTRPDHMISFLFSNEVGSRFIPNSLALFFDDQRGASADRDFNDLVVEVQVNVVPLPTAALASVAGLGGMAFIRRRRMA